MKMVRLSGQLRPSRSAECCFGKCACVCATLCKADCFAHGLMAPVRATANAPSQGFSPLCVCVCVCVCVCETL